MASAILRMRGVVRRDDRVVPAGRSFDDCHVDDVIAVGFAGEDADGLGLFLVHRLEGAQCEEP